MKQPRRPANHAGPQHVSSTTPDLPALAVSIDHIADIALQSQRFAADPAELRCDVCDDPIEGEPSGRGLYMWTRGDEVRFEEPALCPRCATAIGVTALAAWTVEEEEG
ncbi:MAG: hypothetical protein QM820_19485 [Minicystis sp.]